MAFALVLCAQGRQIASDLCENTFWLVYGRLSESQFEQLHVASGTHAFEWVASFRKGLREERTGELCLQIGALVGGGVELRAK